MVSSKKKVLSAFLSLAMIGSMVAAVPLTASAATPTAIPGVTYEVQGQSYGWSQSYKSDGAEAGTEGLGKRLEAIKINLTNAPAGASISYQVHGQSYGWSQAAVVTNAGTDNAAVKYAGTVGQAKRLEAIRITLNGMPGYSVEYKVHQQTYGWGNNQWIVVPNGTAIADAKVAGVTGQSKRLEAIEIKLVPTVATVSAVNSTIGVGGSTTFTFKSADGTAYTPKTATYSLADASFGSIDSTGKFTAGKAGKAVINAVADGVSLSTTVNVYGAAAALTVTPASTSVPANTKSLDAITVTAVDTYGTPVLNYNGTADIAITGAAVTVSTIAEGQTSAGTYSSGTTGKVTLTNGTGTFNVTASNILAISSTVKVTSEDIKNAVGTYANASTTISTSSQTATAITVAAVNGAKYVDDSDGNGTVTFNVNVADQTGAAMVGGTYTLTGAITGGGTFNDGTTSGKTIIVTAGAATPVVVKAPKGVAGTYTLTVTGASLATGAGSVVATVAQAPAKLVVALHSASSASFVEKTGSTVYDLSTTDAVGVPTGAGLVTAHSYVLTLTTASGAAFSNATVAADNGLVTNNNDGTYTIPVTAKTLTITDVSGKADAGTYTAVLKDTTSSGALTAAPAVTFTITPETTVAQIAVSAAKSVLYGTGSTLSTTVTAQLEDENGNAIASSASDVITFATTNFNPVNRGTASFDSTKIVADSTGKAVATLTVQNYDQDAYTVTASEAIGSKTASVNVYLQTNPAASYAFKLKAATTNSLAYVYAGNTVSFVKADGTSFTNGFADSALDSNGNTIPEAAVDQVTVKFTHASGLSGYPTAGTTAGVTTAVDSTNDVVTLSGSLSDVSTAIDGLTLTAAKAGVVTASIADSTTGATGAASITVAAVTTVSGIAVSGLNSNDTLAASALTPITISLVDAGGNAIVATTDTVITLSTTVADASFQDANHVSVTTLTIKAGTSSIAGYVSAPASGTGKISATDGTHTYTSNTLTVA